MKVLAAVIVLIAVLFASLSSAQADTKVWILWGQSVLSSGLPSELSLKWNKIPANTEVWTDTNNIGLKKLTTFNAQAKVGPEVGFAVSISTMYPADQHIIIRYSFGGTAMDRWTVGKDLYYGLLDAISLAVNGRNVKYMAILSDQGETDSQKLALTQQYQSRMTAMMPALRAALGNPDLPWFICIDCSNNSIMPYSLQIAASQLTLVATGGGSVWGIEYTSLPHLPDLIELTTGGVVQLGSLMAYYVQISGLCN
jgi:hypothetical protein